MSRNCNTSLLTGDSRGRGAKPHGAAQPRPVQARNPFSQASMGVDGRGAESGPAPRRAPLSLDGRPFSALAPWDRETVTAKRSPTPPTSAGSALPRAEAFARAQALGPQAAGARHGSRLMSPTADSPPTWPSSAIPPPRISKAGPQLQAHAGPRLVAIAHNPPARPASVVYTDAAKLAPKPPVRYRRVRSMGFIRQVPDDPGASGARHPAQPGEHKGRGAGAAPRPAQPKTSVRLFALPSAVSASAQRAGWHSPTSSGARGGR